MEQNEIMTRQMTEHCTHHSASGIHSMAGIPLWMAISSLAIIIILSHLIIYRKHKKNKSTTYSRLTLSTPMIRRLFQKSWFPLLAQSFSLFLLLLITATGIYGNQRGNISTVLTWTWWWALLIFIIVGFGKTFCLICPWEGLASLCTSLSFTSRIKKIGFSFKWPKWARNVYPALILFIVLTWIELGFGVTNSPSMTATLGLIMTGMVLFAAMVFEKRSFCRYACLIGRISGIYALFSPLELRVHSTKICATCKGRACINGSEKGTGCPLFLNPAKLKENTYCTLCTECIRTCPNENINMYFRKPAADLFHKSTFRWDESIMAVVLLALTSFHGMTMTPYWTRINDIIRAATGLGKTSLFTLLMIILILLPFLIFFGGARVSRFLSKREKPSTGEIFQAFAYALIPVALFYHLAHNGMHFFMEGHKLLPFLSDPFGFGWNLFGTAHTSFSPWLSLSTIWWLQTLFIIIGHVYGVVIADRIAGKIFDNPKTAFKSLIPLIITMILYSGFSIWLISQPMEMRTGM